MSTMSAADQLELLETLVKGVTATKYSSLASLIFLLYDHGITFQEEVFLVWGRDWTYGKALFIFNRYFGLVTLLTDVIVLFTPSLTNKFCHNYLRWEIASSIVALCTTGAILTSRVHAVYGRNWKVTGFIICVLVGAAISSLVIDYVDIPDTAALPFGLTGCYLFNLPTHYKYTWIPPLIIETTQCSFMLYKAGRLYLDSSNFPLLTLIVRDSLFYFLTVFSVLLVNCMIWTAAESSLAEVAIGWVVAIPCTIGSRLLLNMRKRYLAERTVTMQGEVELSSIDFRFDVSSDDAPVESFSDAERQPTPIPFLRKKRSRVITFTVDEFTI